MLPEMNIHIILHFALETLVRSLKAVRNLASSKGSFRDDRSKRIEHCPTCKVLSYLRAVNCMASTLVFCRTSLGGDFQAALLQNTLQRATRCTARFNPFRGCFKRSGMLYGLEHVVLRGAQCNRAAQIRKHDASRVAVTLFSNQFRLRSARSKGLVKSFAAMQASAIQHTLVMKANLGSFERFASIPSSSCFGRVSELFVESKSALQRPQQGLDDGVHLAAASIYCAECASSI